jgi:hypothetical protein
MCGLTFHRSSEATDIDSRGRPFRLMQVDDRPREADNLLADMGLLRGE